MDKCKYHATLIKPVAKGILKGLHLVKDDKNGKESSPQVFLLFHEIRTHESTGYRCYFLCFGKVLGHHPILKIRQLLGNWDNNVIKLKIS